MKGRAYEGIPSPAEMEAIIRTNSLVSLKNICDDYPGIRIDSGILPKDVFVTVKGERSIRRFIDGGGETDPVPSSHSHFVMKPRHNDSIVPRGIFFYDKAKNPRLPIINPRFPYLLGKLASRISAKFDIPITIQVRSASTIENDILQSYSEQVRSYYLVMGLFGNTYEMDIKSGAIRDVHAKIIGALSPYVRNSQQVQWDDKQRERNKIEVDKLYEQLAFYLDNQNDLEETIDIIVKHKGVLVTDKLIGKLTSPFSLKYIVPVLLEESDSIRPSRTSGPIKYFGSLTGKRRIAKIREWDVQADMAEIEAKIREIENTLENPSPQADALSEKAAESIRLGIEDVYNTVINQPFSHKGTLKMRMTSHRNSVAICQALNRSSRDPAHRVVNVEIVERDRGLSIVLTSAMDDDNMIRVIDGQIVVVDK